MTNPPLITTLIAPSGLSPAYVAAASAAITAAGGTVQQSLAVDPPCAHELVVDGMAAAALRAALEALDQPVDVVVQPSGARRVKALMVADMDSTMIGQECIDELADFAGKKAEIAAITERAMHGELDFSEALDARVAALAGLAESVVSTCLAERIRLMPGAATLIATLRALGSRTVLVSGGFTVFTGPIAHRLGFDRQVANVLHMQNGALAGTVARPIVDSATKRAVLLAEAEALGVPLAATLAVGDGANDIPMLEAAGLGIAYHAKPRAAAAADAAIRFGNLTTLLWAQGIRRDQWVVAGSDAAPLALGGGRR